MKQQAVLDREDIALFINAASACTGQTEFYGADREQSISITFLHDYVFGNYRRLYALCLVAGINHYNQARVIERLLAAGASGACAEEGELIRRTLLKLPPQRVYRLFRNLRAARVNNRRTRATLRAWLATRDLGFDAVKYRGLLRSAVRHAHLRLPDDIHDFLFNGPQARKSWSRPLFDALRRARFEQRAIWELPYTVAEGLAAAHKIPRKRFLEHIAPQMTARERQRHLGTATEQERERDLARMPLTAACRVFLSMPIAERTPSWVEGLQRSAQRAFPESERVPASVHAVLDNSYSTRGGARKRNHPLAFALALHLACSSRCTSYRGFWTTPVSSVAALRPSGQTRLADALLDALEGRPDLVLVVSDGFENDPPGAVAEVVRLFREHIDPEGATAIVHLNPVFDARAYMPRVLGSQVPTVGVRDASEVPLKIAFAQFTLGSLPLSMLEDWLLKRFDASAS